MERERMERRFEELLAMPNLWSGDVALLRWLAAQLGRRVEFVRTPFVGGGSGD